MNIDIYYFSGTGNTTWAVKCLSEKLKSLGNKVTVLSLEKVDLPKINIDTSDIIGIAFPIYSSFAPRAFQDFLDRLPRSADKPLFAIATAGYMAGDVTWHTVRKLKKRGYDPFLLGNIIMGNNLHLPRLSPLPVTSPIKMKAKLKKAEDKIAKLAQLIKTKQPTGKELTPLEDCLA